MFKQLQQFDAATKSAGHKAPVAVSEVLLNANIALLLILALIIPTLSGVALVA
jgi:hypothetical protein